MVTVIVECTLCGHWMALHHEGRCDQCGVLDLMDDKHRACSEPNREPWSPPE